MNSKLLMTLSALFMAGLGIVATFAPAEILGHYGLNQGVIGAVFVQVAGALYVGFAILNWTARANLIGGIYSRPVALGNFVHFTVAALALLKVVARFTSAGEIIAGAILYSVFAVGFGFVVFTSPRAQ